MMDLRTLQRTLGGEVNGARLLCPGPGHSTADRSLSVKLDSSAPDGFVVHSFADDDPIVCRDYVRTKAGLPAFKPNGSGRRRLSDDAIANMVMAAAMGQTDKPKGRIVATYNYTDADGALLYQVLRLSQRISDSGGLTARRLCLVAWRLRRVPYRWPDLQKYPDATIFICEGEKDANRVAILGHCATTCVAAGKWTAECVTALAGRDCHHPAGTTTTPDIRRRSTASRRYMAPRKHSRRLASRFAGRRATCRLARRRSAPRQEAGRCLF